MLTATASYSCCKWSVFSNLCIFFFCEALWQPDVQFRSGPLMLWPKLQANKHPTGLLRRCHRHRCRSPFTDQFFFASPGDVHRGWRGLRPYRRTWCHSSCRSIHTASVTPMGAFLCDQCTLTWKVMKLKPWSTIPVIVEGHSYWSCIYTSYNLTPSFIFFEV